MTGKTGRGINRRDVAAVLGLITGAHQHHALATVRKDVTGGGAHPALTVLMVDPERARHADLPQRRFAGLDFDDAVDLADSALHVGRRDRLDLDDRDCVHGDAARLFALLSLALGRTAAASLCDAVKGESGNDSE